MKVKKMMKKCLYGVIVGAMIISTTVIDVGAIADANDIATAEAIVGNMTLEQKVAQMIQPNLSTVTPSDVEKYQLGSVLSGGGEPPASGNTMTDWANAINSYQEAAIKGTSESQHGTAIPLLYGVDAVHGNNNVYGATIFPHNIGLAASQDTDLVKKIGEAVASETIATGANWAFTPSIGVPHNERWGRTYETFGDNADTVAEMGAAYIQGIQSSNQVVATGKHYIGEGLTTNGTNQGNVVLDQSTYNDLIHANTNNATVDEILKPYKAAINEGVATIMVSYNSINDVKCHGNKELVTDLLKGELGFKGIVISDYNGVDQITEVSSYADKVVYSVNAGLDMLMVAGYDGSTPKWQNAYNAILNGVKNGKIAESRINDACTRIIAQKVKLGLIEDPSKAYASTADQDIYGGEDHRAIARQAVSESLTLLKNTKINEDQTVMQALQNMKTVVVAGSNGHNLGNQCGGWTITWQGQSGNNCTEGTTIYEGIRDNLKAKGGNAYFAANGYFEQNVEAAIVVAGETPYAETNGDKVASALKLSSSDKNVIKTIKADHEDLPIILVLVTGRPLTIADQVLDEDIDAIVCAWLPGSEGAGVADVLFGEQDFTGTNPITWPWYADDIESKLTDPTKVLYANGYGLTKDQTSDEVAVKPDDPYLTRFNQEGTTHLEAEKYYDSYSAEDQIVLENNDTTVGHLRVGSYLLYKISTENDAAYDVVVNANANETIANAFQLLIDDKVILDNTMTVPGQGDWTTFKPLDLGTVSIPAGEHTLKVLSKAKDFNLDYFDFTVNPNAEYVPPKEPEKPVVDNGSGTIVKDGAVKVTMSSGENSGNDWYNGNKKIENKNTEKDALDLKTVDDSTITTINVNDAIEYNTFLGMGTSIDESTIHNLWKMSEENRRDFIKGLVDPKNGSGNTLFRLTIGTPDFVACPFYTYYDGTGTELNGGPDWYNETGKGFSIQKDIDYHIIDTIKLIQEVAKESGVEDEIKFFASPWTPPGWMKEKTNSSNSYGNNSLLLKGGKLSDDHIEDAAKYYVRYIEEYAKLDIPIYAMTLQNEPMLEINYPSCAITAAQEAKLAKAIKSELSQSTILSEEQKDVKIWAFDHNPGDLNTYMKTVYGSALDSVDGAAVHDYGGELSNMTTLHNNYGEKSIHLTERSVWGTTGMDRIIQYYRNYAESYNCWVTMLDSNIQTHQWVGTPDVTAFVQDANDPDNYWATPEVYLMGQFSKYIRPGYVRVSSNYGSSNTITNVVFKNPETNELIMVAVNNTNSDQNFKVVNGSVQFNAVLPAKNCATYIWKANDTQIKAFDVPSTFAADECVAFNNLQINDDHTLGNLVSGATAEYFVNVKEAGTYNVLINVATDNTNDKEIQLLSENEVLGSTVLRKFATANGWTTYKQVQIQVKFEKEGIQRITLSVPTGSVNIKDFTFEKTDYIYDIPGYINATDYCDAQGVVVENGYVGAFDTTSWSQMDYVSYRINVQKAGTYPLILEYATPGNTPGNFWIDRTPKNGVKIPDPIGEGHSLPATNGEFDIQKAWDIEFAEAGEYVIKIVPNMNGGFNLKSISIGSNIKASSDELNEGELNSKVINVVLSSQNHQFKNELDESKWQVEGLPEGITYTLTRVSDTEVKVTLTGTEVNDYDTNKTVTIKCDASEIGDEGYTLSDKVEITAVDDPESIEDIEIGFGTESFVVNLIGGTFNADIEVSDIQLSDSLAKYIQVTDVKINANGQLVVTYSRVREKPNYEDIDGTITVKNDAYSDGNVDLEGNVKLDKSTKDPDAIVISNTVIGELTTDKAYDNQGALSDEKNVKGNYEKYYLDVKDAGDYILEFNITNNAETNGSLSIMGGPGINAGNNLASISFGKFWDNTNVSYKTLLSYDEPGQYTLWLRANEEMKLTEAKLYKKPASTVIGIEESNTISSETLIDGSDDAFWAIEDHKQVGYTGTGAYQDYFVNVLKGGKYEFSVNYATEGEDSVVELLSVVDGDETSLGEIKLDSTGKWTIFNNSSKTSIVLPAGEQILRLKVKAGGFNTRSMTFEKVPTVTPVISVDHQEAEVFVGTKDSVIDILGLKVMLGDEDITNTDKVIIDTDFDAQVAGEYAVTVKTFDSDGQSVEKTLTIRVVETPVMEVPNVEIKEGETFDPLAGVKVIDADGNDITDKVTIEVVSNPVDASKAGEYTVEYLVTFADGSQATFKRIVTVAEDTTPVDPVEPTDPTDPVDPVEPTEPTEPTDPVDPVEPTEPTDPVDPVKPTDPTKPVDPATPTDPNIDVKPNNPDQDGDKVITIHPEQITHVDTSDTIYYGYYLMAGCLSLLAIAVLLAKKKRYNKL